MLRFKRGFSLVELSIVLVIIGLLVGGVLTGKSLIDASELRKITSDFTKYDTAIKAFQGKYLALPGDMSNATQFWGKTNVATKYCPASQPGTPSATGVCNGDGNGTTDGAGGAVLTRWEGHNAFGMLSRAGLVEGSYSHVDDDATTPEAALRGTQYAAGPRNIAYIYGNYSTPYNGGIYGRVVDGIYAGVAASDPSADPYSIGFLTAIDAQSMDQKLDDGDPGLGKLMALREDCRNTGNCPAANVRCVNKHQTGSPPIKYIVSVTDQKCLLFYVTSSR